MKLAGNESVLGEKGWVARSGLIHGASWSAVLLACTSHCGLPTGPLLQRRCLEARQDPGAVQSTLLQLVMSLLWCQQQG